MRPGTLERLFAFVSLAMFFDVIVGLEASEGWTSARLENDGNPTIRSMFLMIYVLTLLYLAPHHRRVLALLVKHWLVAAILAIAAISYFWSIDPPLTVRRAGALFGTTAFGLFLAHRFGLHGTLSLVMSVLAAGAILSLLAAFIVPEVAIMDGLHEGAWRGVFSHKNELGQTMALGAALFTVAANEIPKHRLVRIIVALLCAALVVLSSSVTGLATLCTLLLGYAAAIGLRSRQLPVGLTAALLGLGGLTIACILFVEINVILGFFGRDLTLSGRVELWSSVWSYVETRLWLGHGYGAFWRSHASPAAVVHESVQWIASNSHNGWLDLWLEIGMVGLSIFLLAFVAAFWSALATLRAAHGITAYWPVLVLVYLFTTNMAESVMLTQTLFPWVLFVAVTVALREDHHAPNYAVRHPRRESRPAAADWLARGNRAR